MRPRFRFAKTPRQTGANGSRSLRSSPRKRRESGDPGPSTSASPRLAPRFRGGERRMLFYAQIATGRLSASRYGSCHRATETLRREELHEIVVDLIRRLLLQIVAGRQWLRIDEVLRELAPHGRELLRRRLPARSPQNQKRCLDLA